MPIIIVQGSTMSTLFLSRMQDKMHGKENARLEGKNSKPTEKNKAQQANDGSLSNEAIFHFFLLIIPIYHGCMRGVNQGRHCDTLDVVQ